MVSVETDPPLNPEASLKCPVWERRASFSGLVDLKGSPKKYILKKGTTGQKGAPFPKAFSVFSRRFHPGFPRLERPDPRRPRRVRRLKAGEGVPRPAPELLLAGAGVGLCDGLERSPTTHGGGGWGGRRVGGGAGSQDVKMSLRLAQCKCAAFSVQGWGGGVRPQQ